MTSIYDKKQRSKQLMVFSALAILAISMTLSSRLINKLKEEEQNKMELWAEAYRMMALEDNSVNLNLILQVISNNSTIPLIIVEDDAIVMHRNIKLPRKRQEQFLEKKLKAFSSHDPIAINYIDDKIQYLYYNQSTLLISLSYFPYFQIGIMGIFVLITLVAFSNFKKAEENQVWVGLSKETAHQLGTPISSLMAWTELLKVQEEKDMTLLLEMEKDVHRLTMVAERFSKIGSKPDLLNHNLIEVLEESVAYISRRASKKIEVRELYSKDETIPVRVNKALFEWVIENICKNAFDAIEGKGSLEVNVIRVGDEAIIDITDSGKGIPKNKQKTIFNPGYTTKKRGWGLGLSLTKRIVENYHSGKIFVKSSELNLGTTFRIQLPIKS